MKNLYELYEKLYFLSLEERDRLQAKSQINITIYVAFFAIIFYLVKVIDLDSNIIVLILFFILLFISIYIMGESICYTSKALSKHNYKKISSCGALSAYYSQISTKIDEVNQSTQSSGNNDPFLKLSEVFKKNLCQSMGRCVDFNNEVNEGRMSLALSSVNKIKISLGFLAAACFIFTIGDLDLSLPRKSLLIEDKMLSETIKVQNLLLSEISNRLILYQAKKHKDENTCVKIQTKQIQSESMGALLRVIQFYPMNGQLFLMNEWLQKAIKNGKKIMTQKKNKNQY